MSTHHVSVRIELSADEKRALERALYGPDPERLSKEDANDWGEMVLRAKLRELVAGMRTRSYPRLTDKESDLERDERATGSPGQWQREVVERYDREQFDSMGRG